MIQRDPRGHLTYITGLLPGTIVVVLLLIRTSVAHPPTANAETVVHHEATQIGERESCRAAVKFPLCVIFKVVV